MTKGMIPIQKNIAVVDEQGNIYEATYPKRARGLVKNGRARFISEDTICLACPPGILEEHMSDTDLNLSIKEDLEEAKAFQSDKFSMDYVLEQIEKIASQTEYLGQVIGAVGHLESSDELDSDAALEAKALALGDVVRCRETTNQQLIKFYEKMYDNIREASYKEQDLKRNPVEKTVFATMTDFLKTLNPDEFAPEAWEAIKAAATAQMSRHF